MREIGWDGQGFPPQDSVCEFNSNWAYHSGHASWHKVTVVFMSDSTYVVRREDAPEGETSELCGTTSALEMSRFRPFRTPEQIAAVERAKAIDEMWAVYWQPDVPTAKQALGLLYDAGYRKQVRP